MRKITLGVAISILGSSISFASIDTPCKFGKETVADPLCYGPTVLAETTVTGKMLVAGAFNANRSKMGAIEVAGIANMNNSIVKGNTHLMGPLSATHSMFEGNLTIDADKTEFHSSIIDGSLTINSAETVPVLELSCGTSVSGGITFIGKKGVVKKTKDSDIEGKVINGTIENFVSTKKCVLPPVTVTLFDEDDEDEFLIEPV